MTSREAFEAWQKQYPQLMQQLALYSASTPEAAIAVWQAAWEARGKHDAEVCRKIAEGEPYGADDEQFCLEIDISALSCAQAIEEQD